MEEDSCLKFENIDGLLKRIWKGFYSGWNLCFLTSHEAWLEVFNSNSKNKNKI